MHVEVHGVEGAPILALLHGGGLAGWMWDAQVAAFQASHRVLVFDLPGHGDSSEPPFTTIEAASRMIADELRAQDRGRGVCLVGLSLGAQIAVDLVSREPELVDSAMIVSALTLTLPGASLARPMARMTTPLARWRPFAKLQARSMEVPEARFEAYYRDTCRLSAESLGNLLAENMRFTLPEGWSNTRARIHVVVGERERGVMRRSAEALHAALPSSQLTVVPGGRHGVMLQDPEGFNRLLRAHLEA